MAAFVSFIALATVWIIGISAVAVLPAWLLWNWLVPPIFGLPEIGFHQCFGLLVLVGIFLGSSPKVKLDLSQD